MSQTGEREEGGLQQTGVGIAGEVVATTDAGATWSARRVVLVLSRQLAGLVPARRCGTYGPARDA